MDIVSYVDLHHENEKLKTELLQKDIIIETLKNELNFEKDKNKQLTKDLDKFEGLYE